MSQTERESFQNQNQPQYNDSRICSTRQQQHLVSLTCATINMADSRYSTVMCEQQRAVNEHIYHFNSMEISLEQTSREKKTQMK